MGDAIEVSDAVTGEASLISLAGPANKQGRLAADNIAGRPRTYGKTLGTSVLKLSRSDHRRNGRDVGFGSSGRCGLRRRRAHPLRTMRRITPGPTA